MTEIIDQVPAIAGAVTAGDRSKPVAFSFGDPEPVLDRRQLMEHIECWRNGRWYEPPVSLEGLSRTFRSAPHHSSALMVKVNLLTSSFIEHPLLDRTTFQALALDFMVLANCYLEEVRAVTGRTMKLRRSVAKYTRRGVEEGRFFFLKDSRSGGLFGEHEFEGRVHQLMEADLNQEIYGVPYYLSSLNSAFLNEAATIFRRRYYQNGSHAGFILYMTDAAQKEEDIDDLRQALKDSKGPGNFKNLFVYAPNGKKEGIQLIPVGEVAAKDEFLGIKNTSRDDILAAHRVPPQLLGVVPANAGGFGDVAKAANVFFINEIMPLQRLFLGFNRMVGQEVVRFGEYQPLAESAGRAAGG